ncbi:MAG: hypothetical protein O3B01_27615 [Planctomycetota bacterium]|nr:hypothetical protein [Planctomycetota bacterium]
MTLYHGTWRKLSSKSIGVVFRRKDDLDGAPNSITGATLLSAATLFGFITLGKTMRAWKSLKRLRQRFLNSLRPIRKGATNETAVPIQSLEQSVHPRHTCKRIDSHQFFADQIREGGSSVSLALEVSLTLVGVCFLVLSEVKKDA